MAFRLRLIVLMLLTLSTVVSARLHNTTDIDSVYPCDKDNNHTCECPPCMIPDDINRVCRLKTCYIYDSDLDRCERDGKDATIGTLLAIFTGPFAYIYLGNYVFFGLYLGTAFLPCLGCCLPKCGSKDDDGSGTGCLALLAYLGVTVWYLFTIFATAFAKSNVLDVECGFN